MKRKMSEFTRDSIKNHLIGAGKMFYCHVLAVCLGWAAFPILLMVFARYVTVDTPLSIYSVFTTLIYILLLLTSANVIGLNDRKPYKWARYKMKGFVLGAAAGVAVVLVEGIFILIANRFFIVQHPQFLISGVNAYVRMIPCVPFFWFFSLIDTSGAIVPTVHLLSSLIAIPFLSVFAGLGYWLGINGIELDFSRKKRRNGGTDRRAR